MFMTSAPSRLPASSNEDWVRVEASKNRLIWVRPRSEVRFLSTWRLSSTYSSERSSRPVISAAERPSMPSRCRCPRTKVDFDAGVIKARAIGRGGGRRMASVANPARCELSLRSVLFAGMPGCTGQRLKLPRIVVDGRNAGHDDEWLNAEW